MDTQRRPGKPWKCPLNSALPIACGHVTVYRYVFLKTLIGFDTYSYLNDVQGPRQMLQQQRL